ncbi:hypothetical protein EYM_06325 [Ignicoccus islandicus DSM 13165]|uniref:Haloacid dehalogenase n=1 Tax=Ignicoccus islandicus DSM 13165 TaxID=940295 RepID=A0A0U3FLH7_9CREN|nr:hypothetical protein EYM_06325 [Ignicoccus islandicus DSM 13165]
MFKFIAFDVDGVLLTFKSSWAEVHKAFGSVDSIEDMKAYFKGEITYEEWCERDLRRWSEALGREPTEEDIANVFKDIDSKVHPYAGEAVSLSKRRGLGVGLVSAGLSVTTRIVAEKLGIYLWKANPIAKPCRAGVEPKNKLSALIDMVNKLGISLEETIYVGDSIIDLPALWGSGCGIGVGSEELKNLVPVWIKDLSDFPQALLKCLNHFAPAEADPYYEQYKYNDPYGDDFPWIRFLNLD